MRLSKRLLDIEIDRYCNYKKYSTKCWNIGVILPRYQKRKYKRLCELYIDSENAWKKLNEILEQSLEATSQKICLYKRKKSSSSGKQQRKVQQKTELHKCFIHIEKAFEIIRTSDKLNSLNKKPQPTEKKTNIESNIGEKYKYCENTKRGI